MNNYPKYKPSNIDWIKDVPEEWEIKRLKYLADVMPSNIDKKSEEGESKVLLCNYMDVYKNDFITEDLPFMEATASDAQIEKFRLKEGDVIATKDSEDPMDIAIPAFVKEDLEEVVCGYHLTLMRARKKELLGNYLFWLIYSKNYNHYFSLEANGVTRYGIGTYSFDNVDITLPTLMEQSKIANYLDFKTSQIETLISNKEKLIELLKEERTAIINQAVTKGINPDVPMKDSGIEWLGEIPRHWEIIRLKNIVNIRYGLGQPPKQKEGGLPIIRATNVKRGLIDKTDLLFVDPDDLPWSRNPLLKENDIIVVRSGAYTADSALITKEFDGAVTGYDLVVTPTKINPQLLAYSLLSNYMLNNQLFLLCLRAAQPHLNAEDLGNIITLLPPTMEEQEKIVSVIKNENARINTIITKSEQEIELLKEYKTALISEVVTGKVDVRDEKIK